MVLCSYWTFCLHTVLRFVLLIVKCACIIRKWMPTSVFYHDGCQKQKNMLAKKIVLFFPTVKKLSSSLVFKASIMYLEYSVLYREYWAVLNPNFSECRWYSPICRSSQDAEYSINNFVQCTVNILVMKNTLFSLIIKKIPWLPHQKRIKNWF